MNSGDISITRAGTGLGISYAGRIFVSDLGIGLPVRKNWLWTFDSSLELVQEREGEGRDRLGAYRCLSLVFTAPGLYDAAVPIIQQDIKAYRESAASGCLLVETRVLEDISGVSLEDSFNATTFNSPVVLLPEELSYLTYTWGLIGTESSRDGGHFPEAVTGKGVSTMPESLRLAGYSSREDLSRVSGKPFGPLVLYDDDARTLVISPFNHFLISPLRTIHTPAGMGVARGLHGSVDALPRGTTTTTALVFGHGVVDTMTRWGTWLLHAGGKSRAIPANTPLLGGIGFWNCFGGYYTELFRKMEEKALKDLAEYFHDQQIPISYFGLDLWYNYGQIGFAKNYEPDEKKYPRGLGRVQRETGLPYLLHMSAFESPNDYIGRHEFAVEESSAYPMQREFYEALARDFKKSGAFGIWPDFLRTQLQNSKSMRDTLGSADRWFDNLTSAFSDEDMSVMMCMPTIGHYLASTRHQNIIAVRTHTDYMNHQSNQVEALRARGLISNLLPMQRSISPNPPKDTDGRSEGRGRGWVRELQGRWPGVLG